MSHNNADSAAAANPAAPRSITFCVPYGTLVVGTPAVRPVWQSVQALNVAFSVRAAMEVAATTSMSGFATLLLAVAQATGGAMIAEYTNMLLL